MMRRFGVIAVVAAGLALGACSDDPTGDAGTGRLRILLTDAPGDLEEAWIKIEQIVLIRSESDATNPSRIVLEPEVDDWINLLDLQDGDVLELLDAENLPLGNFAQLRFVLDEAYVVTEDGDVIATSGADLPSGVTADATLKCPSCASSGFKVKFVDGGLNITPNSIVTVDFDVSKSFFHEAGKSGQWIVHPVLRATATTIQLGWITGTVATASGVTIPTCGGVANTLSAFRPLAVAGADSLTATTEASGAFTINRVMPGTYTLSFVKDVTYTNGDSLTFTATVNPASVTVAQNDTANATYQITAASCH